MAHGSRLVVALALVGALVAAGGCTADRGQDIEGLHNPTRTTLEPFVEPHFDDTRGVALDPVAPGAPIAFPVTVRGGDASLSGTLTGPEGPVPRGRVRIERFVGEASAALDVTTNARGRWNAKGIQGGRYRVRGWRMPDLAMSSSTVLFLGAEEDRAMDLAAEPQGGVDVQAALLTPTPTIGTFVTVTALVTRHEVDRDGVVQGIPLSGTVATVTGDGWDIPSAQATVDGEGAVRWSVSCAVPRPADLLVSAGGGVARLVVAGCSRPAGPSTPSTSTTVPDEPTADFGVGARFTPPFAGPLPAGTYAVVGDAASCALVYETWVGGAWSTDRRTATGTAPLVLDSFARDLQTIGDAPPCTYERTS